MDVEFSMPTQRSSEEEDELHRNVKKFKESNGARSFTQPRKLVSYKDSLVGDIPRAYEQAFKFDKDWEEEYESDTELEPLLEGMAEVKLFKETKAHIKVPWSKVLIVKVYGRSVGFNSLTFKINALWKPKAKMDCVNLGRDFFLIKFSSNEDYDHVLHEGPWFIGEHFLAIMPWEPYFKASKAKLSSVAVWVRIPELLIEFYDASVLKEIGSVIRPVLHIDSYTASETRGGYARLCVQINLEKPLITSIRVGRLVQCVMYEGVSSLCFKCGRLGHKKENRSFQLKQIVKENNGQEEQRVNDGVVASRSNDTNERVQSESNYGPWIVVTRKRSVQHHCPNGQSKPNQMNQIRTKGISDFSQKHCDKGVGAGKDIGISHPTDSADLIAKTTRIVAAQFPHKDLKMGTECMVEDGLEALDSVML
nr:hypothetical protein CFP56_61084 [Quercus suber]